MKNILSLLQINEMNIRNRMNRLEVQFEIYFKSFSRFSGSKNFFPINYNGEPYLCDKSQ